MPKAIVQTAGDPMDVYTFENSEQQESFQKITKELRCSVCQNESLAESKALLATDLKKVIYEKVLQGENKSAIIQFFSDRYGNYVLYEPPFNWSTSILWIGPFLLILIGLYKIIKMVKK